MPKDQHPYKEFRKLMDSASNDMKKFFETGNNRAGTKARRTLYAIAKLSKKLAADILEIKKREGGLIE
jgi:hypothetical protein